MLFLLSLLFSTSLSKPTWKCPIAERRASIMQNDLQQVLNACKVGTFQPADLCDHIYTTQIGEGKTFETQFPRDADARAAQNVFIAQSPVDWCISELNKQIRNKLGQNPNTLRKKKQSACKAFYNDCREEEAVEVGASAFVQTE